MAIGSPTVSRLASAGGSALGARCRKDYARFVAGVASSSDGVSAQDTDRGEQPGSVEGRGILDAAALANDVTGADREQDRQFE